MTPDEMTTTLAEVLDVHRRCSVDFWGRAWHFSCGAPTIRPEDLNPGGSTAAHRAHVAAVLAATVTEAQAGALREAADEFWRIFLRLPHTPSPLGDYIQRRVLEFRARADSLVERAERGQG